MGAVLTDTDLELLAGCKGKKLKSVEYVPLFKEHGSCLGALKLNLGKSSIKVTCIQESLDFFDWTEDVAVFRCKEVDPALPPYELFHGRDTIARKYLVNDVIRRIEVVREHRYDPEDATSFDMDVTIAFRTTQSTVSLSRGIYFGEDIEVRLDDPKDADVTWLQPFEKVWPGEKEGGSRNETTREVILL